MTKDCAQQFFYLDFSRENAASIYSISRLLELHYQLAELSRKSLHSCQHTASQQSSNRVKATGYIVDV